MKTKSANCNLNTNSNHDAMPPGTFHGNAVPPGTFHGDAVPPGTFHGDAVPPGTFHSVVYYRTKDARADYEFSFERQSDGTWRAYIESQPSYGFLRSSDAHTTHRLSDGGRQYVCWTHPLRSEAEAREVAALWADKTQEYISSGARF